MINGPKIVLGEKEYVVPPLTLGQLKNGVLDKIKKADELTEALKYFESLAVRAEIIHEALKRNYPELALEEVENFLDLKNVGNVWTIVLGGSALVQEDASKNDVAGVSETATPAISVGPVSTAS